MSLKIKSIPSLKGKIRDLLSFQSNYVQSKWIEQDGGLKEGGKKQQKHSN